MLVFVFLEQYLGEEIVVSEVKEWNVGIGRKEGRKG
jgi:hypothetical protein